MSEEHMDLIVFKISGFLLLFVSVFLFVIQFFPDQKEREVRRKTGMDEQREWSEDATLVKWFYPIVLLLLPLVKLLPLDNYKKRLSRWSVNAGIEKIVSTEELICLQIILCAFFPFLLQVLFSGTGVMIVGAFLGTVFPIIWLWEKKKTRQTRILQSMPDLVDMLALSVEAGMDFNSAIVRVCEQYKGKDEPFVDEFVLLQKNLRLGMTREDALNTMANRIDLQDIYSFTSILIQAEKMGSSIGTILKNQSDKLRKERFMKAERLGAEASQKLLIPMVIFIFPLIFFVVLGPYILKFIYGK